MRHQDKLTLSDAEVESIERVMTQEPTAPSTRRVATCLLLLNKGCSIKQVSEVLGIATTTVKDWQKKWLKARSLSAFRSTPLRNAQKELESAKNQIADARDRIETLEKEAEFRGRRIRELEAALQNSKESSIRAIFKEMVSTREGQVALVRLLSLKDEILLPSPREEILLRPLLAYLRNLGLSIEGEKDQEFLLTDGNRDDYALNEPVTLPCRVRITVRGVRLGDTILQRPEVTTEIKE